MKKSLILILFLLFSFYVVSATMVEPARVYCTEEQRGFTMCAEIYSPVCGFENTYEEIGTFSNSCFACSNEEVLFYSNGDCLDNKHVCGNGICEFSESSVGCEPCDDSKQNCPLAPCAITSCPEDCKKDEPPIKDAGYSCKETDDGKDYYEKGRTWLIVDTGNVMREVWDSCSEAIDTGRTSGEKNLIEYYCEESQIKSISYSCPLGCVDGECVETNLGEDSYDCRSNENCEDDEICLTRVISSDGVETFGVCVNKEDYEKKLELQEQKERLCSVRPQAKSLETCGDVVGYWFNGKNCVAFEGCLAFEKDFFPFGVGELGRCKELCLGEEDEEDEGVEEFSCGLNECNLDGKCYPTNHRLGNDYCSSVGEFFPQKKSGEECIVDSECSSNFCSVLEGSQGVCISRTFIERLINWFNQFFG